MHRTVITIVGLSLLSAVSYGQHAVDSRPGMLQLPRADATYWRSPTANPNAALAHAAVASMDTTDAFRNLAPQLASSLLYNRNDYLPSWADVDRNCINTRHEVLIQESLVPVTMNARGCAVVRGLWYDPYTAQTFSDPADVDIDHVVPLKEAHDSGAAWWSLEEKRAYANELYNPLVLMAVDDGANSSKGDKDPARWMPPNQAYHCEYVKTWAAVKDTYRLWMDAAEEDAINQIISAGASALPQASEAWSFTTSMQGYVEGVNFSIGLERQDGCGYFLSAFADEEVALVGTIHPPTEHRGRLIDLFVVDRVNMEFTMQNEDGYFIPWNTRVPDLIPTLRDVELAGSLTFKMLQGKLGVPGDHRVFLGYKVDGVLYFTPEPVRFNVL